MRSGVDFHLYSDGGSMQNNLSAAAACIVEDAITAERVRLLAYLGSGTNNEAEIVGGLLGLSFLAVLPDRQRMEQCGVHWVCDSEYVLKSATSYIFGWQRNGWQTSAKAPVKNQGLWRTYLHLSSGVKITPEHVRGHTGHPENEECDAAIQWMKERAHDLFSSGPRVQQGSIGGSPWILIDLRSEVRALRVDEPSVDEAHGIASLLESSGVTHFTDTPPSVTATNPLIPVLSRLREASSLAEKLRGEVDGADDLAAAIGEVLKRFAV